MKAQEVELVLFEQSLAVMGGMDRPFYDRVCDIAEKTGGVVLFDLRVDGDARVCRMGAIGYGASGTVTILLARDGQLTSAPISQDNHFLVDELTAWALLPMAEQARIAYRGTAVIFLAKLRASGAVP
jgi:hypothetical protein